MLIGLPKKIPITMSRADAGSRWSLIRADVKRWPKTSGSIATSRRKSRSGNRFENLIAESAFYRIAG
jgi:hypothetical protein